MTRNLYLIALFFITIGHSIGQAYDLSVSQEEYVSLENPTILTDQGYRLDTAFELSLPFDFNILDQRSNSIWITSKGNIAFGPSYDSLNHFGINAFRIELQSDFSDPTVSPILYEISGTKGERVVKIEWENAYFRALEGFFDYINMQVWMYELDHSVELRYGESSLELITTRYQDEDSLGHFGGIVGIAYNSDTSYIGTNLTGDSTLPTINNLIVNEATTIPEFRLGFPKDSTVFRLTRVSTLNEEIQQNNISVVHSADLNALLVQNEMPNTNTFYQLSSSGGQIVNSGILNSASELIDVSKLATGIYIFTINNPNFNQLKSWKFSIQN